MKKSLLDVISEVGAVAPDPFMAPFPEAGVGRVLTVQHGAPFWLTVKDQKAGWWHVIPTNRTAGKLGDWVRYHERVEYLEQLPCHRVLLLFPVGRFAWLCSPVNAADAAQRGWPDATPRLLHLIDFPPDQAFWLEPVFARDLAGALLYERPGGAAHLLHLLVAVRQRIAAGEPWADLRFNSDLDRAARLVEDHVHRLRERAEQIKKKTAAEEEAETVRKDLAFMGAELVSWEDSKVSYEYNGVTHEVEIDPARRVTSAGICLSGTDGRHDLASVVVVLEEARRLHRFDMEEEKWL